MPAKTHPQTRRHALGEFGLLLMLVVARLAGPAYEPTTSLRGRVRAVCARRAIDGIAAIGWLFDHLPPGAAGHRHVEAAQAAA
jgi:hypothetical protein